MLIVYIDQEVIKEVNGQIRWFSDFGSFFRNISLSFLFKKNNRIVPPSWALSVELLYYFLIALGISKTKRSTWFWFLIGLIYTLAVVCSNAAWEYQYFHFGAGSLPFSIGALLYHYQDLINEKVSWLTKKSAPIVLFGLVAFNYLVAVKLQTLIGFSFYLNLLFSTILVTSLLNQKKLLFISKRLDSRIGDYSYPIYLVHIQAAVLLHYFTGLPRRKLQICRLCASDHFYHFLDFIENNHLPG